ncbi:MAG: hypothetical protein HC879_16820 [Leptolyngbyaceae cyanobacterium SL_5_9]|nr:hypothetical protein [Leptolyngbyaceae cyanobacterium SL_5_9]NJO76674.1 hypothetical protein [Leptolyngbyaceae cyanobacterium RM1_406_9]
MLLLYVRLFERQKPPPKEASKPSRSSSNSQTHSQTQTYTTKQVRRARSTHYLERRLFL